MTKKKKKTIMVEPSPPPEEILAKPYSGLVEPKEDTPPED